ncbi:MAG: cell division protein FtsQ/DivIB [Anaerolineae bacterium]
MKIVPLPQKSKSRRRRRSTRRLGNSTGTLNSAAPRSPLAFKPALNYWQVNQSRITGLTVLLLCIWIIYLMIDDDSFYVYRADITGNHILSAQEIYAAGQIHNQSVFWVNPKTAKANLEALPNIKTARVKITLPAKVTIEVEERRPEVVWQTGNETWWIDSEGTFVPPRPESEPDRTRLRITDIDARPVEPSDRLSPAIIRGAQLVNEHKPDITDLYYTRSVGLVYLTPEGWPVYLGNQSDMALKLSTADSVRADLLARSVTPAFIDVRNPRRVVYQQP